MLLDKLKQWGHDRKIAQARKLAFEGRYRDALKLAEEGEDDLVLADSSLLKELVVWRNRARQGNAAPGFQEWPWVVADPFPDLVDQIPEVTPDRLTPELLAGALAHHGSLVVRGLFDPSTVQRLRADMDRAFEARAEGRRTGPSSAWYSPAAAIDDLALTQMRAWMDDNASAVLMSDSPAFFARWIALLRSSGLHALLSGYFGEEPVLSAKKATLYRSTAEPRAQWHQTGAFMGAQTHAVNVWTALTDCGQDAPSLDVVPWRLPGLVPPGTHGAYWEWSIGNDLAEEMLAGRPKSRLLFKPGDALLLDPLCMHKMGSDAGMTQSNCTLESWLFAPSSYPDKSRLAI